MRFDIIIKIIVNVKKNSVFIVSTTKSTKTITIRFVNPEIATDPRTSIPLTNALGALVTKLTNSPSSMFFLSVHCIFIAFLNTSIDIRASSFPSWLKMYLLRKITATGLIAVNSSAKSTNRECTDEFSNVSDLNQFESK
jgi:hypothetical protein